MPLRRSAFLHLIPLHDAATLVVHAVTQLRVTVTPQVARLIGHFDSTTDLEAMLPRLAADLDAEPEIVRGCARLLLDRGILTEASAEDECASMTHDLALVHGRDPEAQIDRWRRVCQEGSHPYWAVAAPRGLDEAVNLRHRVDALVFGDCDVQMETDFLRREAARRGVDLRVVAAFANDTDLAGERPHDVIVIGALAARHTIVLGDARHHEGDPSAVYIAAARHLLEKLRAVSAAPILLDGLPEPTLQPLGMADRGPHSHRNRFRRTNLALTDLVESFPDVHLVDVAAALAAEGAATLLDDGLVAFTHFGAPGWMLQRPESELAAVHGLFPDMAPLARAVGGDPYRREAVMARAHMDVIASVLALDARKCVIVDLDGVLWPGVLAETGSPFGWGPEISGPNSYVGLYFGIHEALKALQRRGILLACVSKNDEATVRALWRYPEDCPRHRLLTPDLFAATRINWQNKADNIRSIAQELGFATDAFVFIDDSPHERELVRHSLPDVVVLGEDLFALRRTLLTDPRLQPPRITAAAADRGALARAGRERAALRTASGDSAAFHAGLDIVGTVQCLSPATADAATLDRVRELFQRTTQCNATGRRFASADLHSRLAAPGSAVFTLHMRDRLADHGLVGAAVVSHGEILNVALSCRVIGLGGEQKLLAGMAAHAAAHNWPLRGRIVPTDRNAPVRHLFRNAGFHETAQGCWTLPPP